jgi:large subunit ribosomal protein L20
MTRVKGGTRRAARRNRIVKLAKGFRGRRKNLFRTAKESVNKALTNAYRDRRAKKRTFRQLWIIRINAAVRSAGLTYSRFIDGLGKAGVSVNRKMLADLAINNPDALQQLILTAKNALPVRT